jgi:hypothetical protein
MKEEVKNKDFSVVNGKKVTTGYGRMCITHKLHKLSYLEWMDEAEKRTKRGMKQRRCDKCNHWFFMDEF